MRGNPVKEWIIFSILWLLLLIPVMKLTGSKKHPERTAVQPIATEDSVRKVEAIAVIRYTGKPYRFKISQDNRLLSEITSPPQNGTECTLTLHLVDNYVELHLQAQWPDEQMHVFEIELIIDNLDEKKVHCWAQQMADEIITFEW